MASGNERNLEVVETVRVPPIQFDDAFEAFGSQQLSISGRDEEQGRRT
jgi:hypothetical protein